MKCDKLFIYRFSRNTDISQVVFMPKKSPKHDFSGLNTASKIAFGLLIPILGGFFLGHYLDNRFSTEPWLTLLFLMLGVVIGFAGVYRSLNS